MEALGVVLFVLLVFFVFDRWKDIGMWIDRSFELQELEVEKLRMEANLSDGGEHGV